MEKSKPAARKPAAAVPARAERVIVRQLCERALDGDYKAQDYVMRYILQQGESRCAVTLR